MKRIIQITVEGGLIQEILNIPDDIQIEVRDYDTDGDPDDDDTLETDSEGNAYRKCVWEKESPESPEAIKQYIDSGGVNCPYCGSSELQGGSFDMEGGMVNQNVKCLACEKEWTDLYKLHGIWTLEEGEVEND